MTVGPDAGQHRATLPGCARWLLHAGPSDYLLAMSAASASLPVIGKRLEPLGSAAAMGIWGYRHLPDFLAAACSSRARSALSAGVAGGQPRQSVVEVSAAAVADVVPTAELDIEWPAPEHTPPVWRSVRYRRHLHRTSVHYGDDPAQVLDVWRRRDLPRQPAPVLIFVPGGAWVHGSRMLQGYALLSALAAEGWVCLSIDYRVAPRHRWPQHITDVKTAVAWARANVDKYGGDRNFVALAGNSAGGHLAALAGLTGNDAEMQTQLPEGSHTAVDAVVSIYGRYDWEDTSTAERARFVDFLERVVVGRSKSRHPGIYRRASPIARVHPDAPPFLVVHGSADTVIPVEQARTFVDRLRGVSQEPVSYLELPGAGHGFDMTDGARTGAAVTAIGLFLNQIHRSRTSVNTAAVI